MCCKTVLFSAQHYIPHQDRHLYFSSIFMYDKFNKFYRPVSIMGKNIKSYATTPSPFPREREGSLTAKSPKSFV